MITFQTDELFLHGSLFQAFVKACDTLKILLHAQHLAPGRYESDEWYPRSEFDTLLSALTRYSSTGLILQHIGAEMMKAWYDYGGGKQKLVKSLDFLKLQTGSAGFSSVVKGPPEQCGQFAIERISVVSGEASIVSTTPFPLALEYGILHGGLGLVGDLLYYRIEAFESDKKRFTIYFVTDENRKTLSWNDVPDLTDNEWTIKHYLSLMMQSEQFAHCLNASLSRAYRQVESKLSHDEMTGLLNRKAVLTLAEKEFARAKRQRKPICIAYLDIDFFKRVNDSYGHAVGDVVIQRVAKVLTTVSRAYDLVGRLGGEEFAMVLPDMNMRQAEQFCERIHSALRETDFFDEAGNKFSVTISIGVAELSHQLSMDALLKDADMSLLKAKRAGRNRTIVYSE